MAAVRAHVAARPKAVFFDVGGTLLKAHPSVGHVYADVLRRFGRKLDPLLVQSAFEAGWGAAAAPEPGGRCRFSSHPGGELGFWRQLINRVLSEAGDDAKLGDEEFATIHRELSRPDRYRLFPDTLPVLSRLRAAGVTLAVVSNWDGRLPALLDGLGVARYFSAAVVSGIEGREKPAPEMFARACAQLSVAPGEVLHVGDAERDDYQGARAAGLEALLLDRSGQARGGHVIHDLVQVLARLGVADAEVA